MASLNNILLQIGNLLSDANNKTNAGDTTLTDAVGTLIEGYGSGISSDVNVSQVVDYYKNTTKNAFDYVSNLGTNQWVHHIVMTDSHFNTSNQFNDCISVPIVYALQNTGLFSKFIHLGDLTNMGNNDELDKVVELGLQRLNGDMLYAIGNHEVAGNNEIRGRLYDLFMSTITNVEYHPLFNQTNYSNPSYVYKDTNHKIAYIHLSYWSKTQSNADLSTWLYNEIMKIEDEYTIVVFGHNVHQDLGVTFINKMKSAFAFLPETKKVFGYLGGHRHKDIFEDNGIYKAYTLLADAQRIEPDLLQYRVKGTDSEGGLTIISIGINGNNRVKVYRIGSAVSDASMTTPHLLDTELTVNHNDDVFLGMINTSGSVDGIDNISDMYLQKRFIEIEPNTYYYIYSPNIEDIDISKRVNKAEYTNNRIDSFISGTRFMITTNNINELNVAKVYTNASARYLIVGCDKEDIAKQLVVSKNAPLFDVGVNDVNWVAGSIDTTCIPSTSTTRMMSDRPIRVKPNTKYKLRNNNISDSVFVGYAKGPNISTAVNRTRDGISRASGNLPFEFTTPSDCNYIMISYLGTSSIDGWSLEEDGVRTPIYTQDELDAIVQDEVSKVTPKGSTTITENGTFDVSQYASAIVNVESDVPDTPTPTPTPSGGDWELIGETSATVNLANDTTWNSITFSTGNTQIKATVNNAMVVTLSEPIDNTLYDVISVQEYEVKYTYNGSVYPRLLQSKSVFMTEHSIQTKYTYPTTSVMQKQSKQMLSLSSQYYQSANGGEFGLNDSLDCGATCMLTAGNTTGTGTMIASVRSALPIMYGRYNATKMSLDAINDVDASNTNALIKVKVYKVPKGIISESMDYVRQLI